jgi:predicted ABC-type ATPase
VADRIAKGGHSIPGDVIERRYHRGISNLFNLYIPVCDRWMIVNNETITPEPIAEGGINVENIIINEYIWQVINDQNKRDGAE